MSKIYVSPNAYLGRSETFFCRDSVEVFILQFVEEKCATNASSPGGDAFVRNSSYGLVRICNSQKIKGRKPVNFLPRFYVK